MSSCGRSLINRTPPLNISHLRTSVNHKQQKAFLVVHNHSQRWQKSIVTTGSLSPIFIIVVVIIFNKRVTWCILIFNSCLPHPKRTLYCNSTQTLRICSSHTNIHWTCLIGVLQFTIIYSTVDMIQIKNNKCWTGVHSRGLAMFSF